MCQLFIGADPALWETRLRSVRMHGYATSVRLENIYWRLLGEIAGRDRLSVAELLARLYEELLEAQGEVDNFASFLRVCCVRYLMLQMAGDIPADRMQPIGGLDAPSILARERRRLAGPDDQHREASKAAQGGIAV
ncbi:ribbon-helix-helix domain-containing protein [Rhodoblastus sp.]|uniref:ribbon-helix-helix domain-containing protein n=1 Tax=Rhodoblastus sp. TaxID=1962975 RepID=UPI003F9E5A30